MNLRTYIVERENKDYFRAARNDLSLKKRTASYITVGAVAGVGGALAMLVPAIGPLIAAPTYFTLLSVSTTLVSGAVLTSVPLAAQYALLRKDNKLYKAERSVQKAAKIQAKLEDKDYSDRKYASLTKKRDKNLAKFNRVHDMYATKTKRLAAKLYATYDVEKHELNADDAVYAEAEAKTGLGRFTAPGSRIYDHRMKKFEKYRRVYDELHEDYVDYHNIEGKVGTSVQDFKDNMAYRSARKKTVRGAKKVAGATALGIGAVGRTGIYAYGASKGALKRFYAKHFMHEYESSYDSPEATGMPAYVERSTGDMNIFARLRLVAESIGSANTEDELVAYNPKKDVMESLQPRFVRSPLMTKEKYLDKLQNESVEKMPLPVRKGVSLGDYEGFYKEVKEKPEYADRMKNIADAYSDFNKSVSNAERYLDKESIDGTVVNSKYYVQLDLDSPNVSIYKEFDDLQKAYVYTRNLESFGAENFKNKNCSGFRITSWKKEGFNTYSVNTGLSTKVTSEKELEESQKQMHSAFLKEMFELHRTYYIKTDETSPSSTVEIIKVIEEMTGNGTFTKEELVEELRSMPSLSINTPTAEEHEIKGKPTSEINKEFMSKQFDRTARPAPEK